MTEAPVTEAPAVRRLWRARRDFARALDRYHLYVVLLVSGAPDHDAETAEQLRLAFESAYLGFTGELARSTYAHDQEQ